MPSALASHGWFIRSSGVRAKRNRQHKMAGTSTTCLLRFAERRMIMTRNISFAVGLLSLAIASLACDRGKDVAAVRAQSPAATSPADPAVLKPSFPSDAGPPPKIDGARAMQYLKEIV